MLHFFVALIMLLITRLSMEWIMKQHPNHSSKRISEIKRWITQKNKIKSSRTKIKDYYEILNRK